jgi:hypothetical protein
MNDKAERCLGADPGQTTLWWLGSSRSRLNNLLDVGPNIAGGRKKGPSLGIEGP